MDEAWDVGRRKLREEPPGVQMAGDDNARLRPPSGVCDARRSNWCGAPLDPAPLPSSNAPLVVVECRSPADPPRVSSNGLASRLPLATAPENDGVMPRPASSEPKSEGVIAPSIDHDGGVPP